MFALIFRAAQARPVKFLVKYRFKQDYNHR